MYNSHTTYFVLASIFLSVFLKFPSSNSKQPVVMLCFLSARSGAEQRDGTRGGDMQSFRYTPAMCFCFEWKKYTTPKTVGDGLFKIKWNNLTSTRMILTLDSKSWVSVPHLTWKPATAGVRYLQRGRNVQLGPSGGKERFRFFTWKVPMKPPKKVNAGWRTLATKWQKIVALYHSHFFFQKE